MPHIVRFLILMVLVMGGASRPGLAEAQTLTTRYTISLIGLPVGRAEFQTELRPSSYSVSGTLGSAGLADLVSKTNGRSSVSGRIRPDRLEAERYLLSYTSDKKSWKADVRYKGGRAVSADTAPPLRQPPPNDYVPVTQNQLSRVVDPLSGLMVKPGREAAAVCRRTLPFYDGWSRLDLQLSPDGEDDFEADGYRGKVQVCNVRIKPVGGYRSSSNGLKFLANKTLKIWFAPVRDSGIYAPVYVRIPTQVGPLSLTATTFAKPST